MTPGGNPLEAAFASGGANTGVGLPTEMNVAVGLFSDIELSGRR